jgi:hypothetical protein
MTKTMKRQAIRLKRRKTKARPIKHVAKASNKPAKRAGGHEALLAELRRRLLEISDLSFAGA